jgi:hypothetical protein
MRLRSVNHRDASPDGIRSTHYKRDVCPDDWAPTNRKFRCTGSGTGGGEGLRFLLRLNSRRRPQRGRPPSGRGVVMSSSSSSASQRPLNLRIAADERLSRGVAARMKLIAVLGLMAGPGGGMSSSGSLVVRRVEGRVSKPSSAKGSSRSRRLGTERRHASMMDGLLPKVMARGMSCSEVFSGMGEKREAGWEDV